MSLSKQIYLSRDFAAGVYLSEAQNPIPPPLLTHCNVYTVTYSHMEAERGGELNQREGLESQQFTKLGRKYQHDCLYLQSINSNKHLTQSPFTCQF